MRVTPCCNMPFVGVADMTEHNFFHINRVLLFLLRSNFVLRLLRHRFPLLLLRKNRQTDRCHQTEQNQRSYYVMQLFHVSSYFSFSVSGSSQKRRKTRFRISDISNRTR